MAAPSFSLIVLRAANPDALAEFYSNLGLTFTKHRHGKGPEHLSAEMDQNVVFEIYPLMSGETPTTSTRIGFAVPSVNASFDALIAEGAKLVSGPKASEWGLRAVIDDPEGHRIELTERKWDAKTSASRQGI